MELRDLYIDNERIKLGDEHLLEEYREGFEKIEIDDGSRLILSESHLDQEGWIKGVHFHDEGNPDACRCPDCTYTFKNAPDHIKFTKYLKSEEIVKDIIDSRAFTYDLIGSFHSEIEDARYNGNYHTLKELIQSLFVVLRMRLIRAIEKYPVMDSVDDDEKSSGLMNLKYVSETIESMMSHEYLTFPGNPHVNKIQAQVAVASKSVSRNIKE